MLYAPRRFMKEHAWSLVVDVCVETHNGNPSDGGGQFGQERESGVHPWTDKGG
jgi:hypothetical protein